VLPHLPANPSSMFTGAYYAITWKSCRLLTKQWKRFLLRLCLFVVVAVVLGSQLWQYRQVLGGQLHLPPPQASASLRGGSAQPLTGATENANLLQKPVQVLALRAAGASAGRAAQQAQQAQQEHELQEGTQRREQQQQQARAAQMLEKQRRLEDEHQQRQQREQRESELKRKREPTKLHPKYRELIREYPFQPVRTNQGQFVNIILVRSQLSSPHHRQLYEKYKDEILFMGISSMEDYPLVPPNPYTGKWPADEYVGLFPGFLHMFRDTSVFPSHVKLLLMSQSDFSLPYPAQRVPKKYDFTFSGSDQDVNNDCVGWSSFAKNWTFAKEALEVMCGELGMTGVLVATKDKQNVKACSIPKVCEGKIVQTTFLDQRDFLNYVKQSRFLFVPQVHDASPRVATQALALDVPLLMNYNLIGGWKYLNEKTGEFFHDMSDFRESLQRFKRNEGQYEPSKWVREHYGDAISGARLKDFVEENFPERIMLPPGTLRLFPSGA
ncbi:unnamed protein product, partial [Polarella glacialis]